MNTLTIVLAVVCLALFGGLRWAFMGWGDAAPARSARRGSVPPPTHLPGGVDNAICRRRTCAADDALGAVRVQRDVE